MQAVKIKDVTTYLESIAPIVYQESYDNSGLITGNPGEQIRGILVTLDCTEGVVDEAIAANCNLIVAHHPILFKGVKRLTGKTYVERTLIKAIKNDIAIYAIHTNLDNVIDGVNRKIAEKLDVRNVRVLRPLKSTLSKIVAFVPKDDIEAILAALHHAGAGHIGNYNNCSFQVDGLGTFQPGEKATPLIGETGKQEIVKETRIELIFPSYKEVDIISAIKKAHPYEEVAYYITPITNEDQNTGSGLIGELESPIEPIQFLKRLKSQMNVSMLRHTALPKSITKVAVCGGAGSFLLADAIAHGADVFVSSDFKYHEFFDAEGKIMIADIGHYESEQFTKDLLSEVLSKKFTTFAINFSKTVTNPISYL
ncbi:Nif3-like dinuclear metal center hexameric protein [soil metagenome]